MKKLAMSALVEVAELKNFYTPQSLESLKASIKEEGQKTPVFVSENNEIMSGYRIVDAMKELGEETVEVVIIEGKPSLSDYISRNHVREKTPDDKVKELRHLFERFRKRQGKRNPDGTPYSRDEKISEALKGRFKGDVIINKLEKVINNDLPGDILTKGIIENNWKVDTCHEFLTKWKQIDEEKKYGYTDKLISGELNINQVNKFIEERDYFDSEYKDTLIIPEKVESFRIDSIDFSKKEEYHNCISLIFTSVPYYFLRKYDNDDPNQKGLEETKDEYCEGIANVFKSLIPTLKEDANVIINIGETYDNGVGLGIPDLLKSYIESTGLIYKDRLVWSKSNPKPQNETIKRTINNVEYLLWFVVDPKKARYKMLTYSDGSKKCEIESGVRDISSNGMVHRNNKSLSKPYKKIYTHIKEQEIENIINLKTSKNHDVYKVSKEGHPAIMNSLLPVVPILMCTDEGDTVLDPFAGTNIVGRMACLLNRFALSCELSEKYFKIGCKVTENAIKEFDKDSYEYIIDSIYESSITDSDLNIAA